MPSPEIQAVIFDCDGTLVDSESISLRVLVNYVAEFRLQIPHEEAMKEFAGNELSVVFAEIERRLGHKLPDDFLHEFRRRQIATLREQVTACQGAGELLAELTLPYCVASNAPRNKIEICLQTTGLRQHFSDSDIYSAYDIEVWKPAPDLFLKAAAGMCVDPTHCAVVEDSRFGIEAGLAAGMQVFVYDPHRHHRSYPDVRCVATLTELAPLLHTSD